MTEYLIYVSLVFIPIAFWIAYLLHRDSFDIKTIVLVLVISYLMITAFPFSIQHLGTGVTILVYGVILAVLIMVVCDPQTLDLSGHEAGCSPEWVGKSPLTMPGGETAFFPVMASPAHSVQESGQCLAGIDNSLSRANDIPEIQEIVQVNAGSEDLSVESAGVDNTDNAGALADLSVQPDEESISRPTAVPPKGIIVSEEPQAAMREDYGDSSSADINDTEEISAGHFAEVAEPSDESGIQVGSDTEGADSTMIFAEEYFPTLSGNVIIDEGFDLTSDITMLTKEQPSKETEDCNLPVQEDYQETDPAQHLHWSGTQEQTTEVAAPDEQADAADFIELGFAAKSQGDLSLAAKNFRRALQSSTDEELQYLLGMELVSILQNMGDYEQADVIMDDLISSINDQPTAVRELKQQRQYNSLLADELDRLGLSNTPIFEVPRFVRIKVNEKMLA